MQQCGQYQRTSGSTASAVLSVGERLSGVALHIAAMWPVFLHMLHSLSRCKHSSGVWFCFPHLQHGARSAAARHASP